MELKIENKTEQPLLSRSVLKGRISFDATTPSRAEIKKKLSEAIKADESLVQITMIRTDFGQKGADVTAHVYKKKEELEKYTSRRVKVRHLSKEELAKLKASKQKQPAEGGN